jgi:hypothetical protein
MKLRHKRGESKDPEHTEDDFSARGDAPPHMDYPMISSIRRTIHLRKARRHSSSTPFSGWSKRADGRQFVQSKSHPKPTEH